MKKEIRHKICERMRAAKNEKRLNSIPPEYPAELPDLRRKIIIIDYDSGKPVRHVLDLYKSDRIDCFKVFVDGKLWKTRMGYSRILAGIRKAMPRARNMF